MKILLTDEEIDGIGVDKELTGYFIEDLQEVAKAQLKKVVEEITPILVDTSITMGRKLILITNLIADWQTPPKEEK